MRVYWRNGHLRRRRVKTPSMQTFIVLGLALVLSAPVFAQVRFTPPPPAPDPNPPRLQPSPNLTEDLNAIEAFSRLLKGKPAEELYSAPPPPRRAREVTPSVPRSPGPAYGGDQWQREYEAEMNRLNQERPRAPRRRAWGNPSTDALQMETEQERRARRAEHRQRERDFFEDLERYPIEPGHIPYMCDTIVGNPRARKDCQESWQASDPNDHLNYGR